MNVVLTGRPDWVPVRAACAALGVPASSYYYRKRAPEHVAESKERRCSHRALSEQEEEKVLAVLNSEAYADQPPAEVHASLLDQGIYHCSTRTMQRLLKRNGQNGERRPMRTPEKHAIPRLSARAPNQVWTLDVTKCATLRRGIFLNLYVVMDLFSRFIVAWMLSRRENAKLLTQLVTEAYARYEIPPGQLTVHQDRGAPMTDTMFLRSLVSLPAIPSHSRPRVSNDNPFIESHFHTVKSQPDYPGKFHGVADGRAWFGEYFKWFVGSHHHSGIAFYTPEQVFTGSYREVEVVRQRALDSAYARHPERFVGGPPRVPRLPQIVTINAVPEGSDLGTDIVNYPTLPKVQRMLTLH